MSTTAQGTSIRCDAPNCALPATIEEGVWGFCAAHAGKTKTADDAPTQRPVDHLSRAHTASDGPKICAGCGVEIVREAGRPGRLPSRCAPCRSTAT